MKVSPVSFKAKFIIPNNEINQKIDFLYPKAVKIGKKIQATTTLANDKITIDSYKGKDEFVRRVLNRLGVVFKEVNK